MTQEQTNGKAREFWIDDLTQRICAPWDHETLGIKTMPWPDNEKVFHVIEYSAYEKAIAELKFQVKFMTENMPASLGDWEPEFHALEGLKKTLKELGEEIP